MPIKLNCPKCRKPFRVRDESAGMRVKCPTCGAVLLVPANPSPSSFLPESHAGTSPASAATKAETGHQTAPEEPDSLLDDLPPPSPTSGPPSLGPTQSMRKHDRDIDERVSREESRARTGASENFPPIPTSRRVGSTKPIAAQTSRPHVNLESIVEETEGWRKVRKGLRWVQLGFLLASLPAIGHFALAAFCLKEHDKIPDNFAMVGVTTPDGKDSFDLVTQKGLLEKKNLTLWKEMEVVYLFGIPIIAYLLILIGLAGCVKIPASAHTRGVAGGTLFLTFVAFAAFAVYTACILSPIFGGPSLPREVKHISWTVFIFIGLLAIGWLYIYLGQAGYPLHSTQTLRDTAFSILLFVVLIAGVLIANDFYPLLMSSSKVNLDHAVEVYLIQAGVFLVISMLFVLRTTSIIGLIRKASRRWIEDNKVTI